MAELFVLFALFALATVAFGAFIWWREEQRRKALAALAQQLGLRFDPQRHRLEEELRDLEATSLGRRRSRMNELSGTYQGRDVRCFDYWCKVKQGKSDVTRIRGVVLVRVPRAWPALRVVPEHVGHKLADALGADDIDFESQEFSDRFWVRSPDPKFAYDLITPRMMEFLMDRGLDRWEIQRGYLCLWADRSLDANEVQPAIHRALRFLELVPRHVRASEGLA